MKVHYFSVARFFIVLSLISCGATSFAQTCMTADDMDVQTRTAMQNTAMHFFDLVARGDAASLKQESIPDVANNFASIENTIKQVQPEFASAHPSARPPFELKAEGTAPIQRAEFLCGVFNGAQAAKSAEIVIPNFPPGTYGLIILDVPGQNPTYNLTFILQQSGSQWKLGGFFLHPAQVAGHDYNWFLEHGRDFKSKGQNHNAFLYFLQARELAMPISFLYSEPTDKMYDEEQSVRPNDFPIDGSVVDIAGANGKSYKVTAIFPVAVQQNLYLVARYQNANISDTGQTFQENMNVMRSLVAKFPELRDGFDGVVIRAVEPSGRDYGSMMAMKEIK